MATIYEYETYEYETPFADTSCRQYYGSKYKTYGSTTVCDSIEWPSKIIKYKGTTACAFDWYYSTKSTWYNNCYSTKSTWYNNCYSSESTWHNNCYSSESNWVAVPLTKDQIKNKLSQIIQSRCSPNIIIRNSKRKPLPIPADVREQRARETLRRVIGDQKYLSFIKNGFVSVKGNSGLVYQIFTGHDITHVFDQGNLVERLCVVLQGGFPPTDSLIMRYLLILNNESQFRSLAIKHSINGFEKTHQNNGPAITKTLAELFKELKSKAA